jgi:inner membrane protein
MHKTGHYGINAFTAAILGGVVTLIDSATLGITAGVIVFVLARLPDIDRHFDENFDTRRSNRISELVPVRHRGFTHTVWFAAAIGFITGVFTGVVFQSLLGFVVGGVAGVLGVLSHVFGDALTPRGVTPLSPLGDENTVSFDVVTADNETANTALFVGGTVTAAVILATITF